MRRQIIAMGGGGFSMEAGNPLLDEYVLKQTGKRAPRVCFLGTASGDADAYVLKFYTAFLRLSCVPTHLSLFKPPAGDLKSFILEQDVVYVGGGNTKSMLALWREWGLDDCLRAAWEGGVVLAGISAGSVCWFEGGLSDFLPGELNRLECLGFLGGSNCPHYDGEKDRRPAYHRLILSGELAEGVAAEDGVALHYVGTDLAHVVSSRAGAKAYFVRRRGAAIVEEAIDAVYLGGEMPG